MKLPTPKFWIENLYSPSAGKMCRATMPPRVQLLEVREAQRTQPSGESCAP